MPPLVLSSGERTSEHSRRLPGIDRTETCKESSQPGEPGDDGNALEKADGRTGEDEFLLGRHDHGGREEREHDDPAEQAVSRPRSRRSRVHGGDERRQSEREEHDERDELMGGVMERGPRRDPLTGWVTETRIDDEDAGADHPEPQDADDDRDD